MSDIHWYQKSVGLSPPKLNFGICQDRLHWKKLKEMKKEHRDAEVIKRANLYAFNWGYIGMKGVDGFELSMAIEDAIKEKKYSHFRKDIAAPQVDRLRLQFPLLDKGTGPEVSNNTVGIQGMFAEARKERNPDAARLASEFQKVITDFQKTELCHQVKTMARRLFQSRQVNRLVAYGLGGLSSPTPPGHPVTINSQKQHAALLAIRDTWKEEHKDAKGSFDIYLADPDYWEVDEKAAAHFGMTVVNGDIGHQMGYLLIDESTLVVDLIGGMTVLPLVFEITRPAGLITVVPILDPEVGLLPEPVIFSYTLTVHNKERGQKEEIIFPGLGVSKTAMVEEGLHEYTDERFDVSKCDVGTHPDWAKTPPPGSTSAGPSKSKTVTSKATHEPTPPTAPMESTPAGPSKSKTVASKATHEPTPPTAPMESTPAGPSKSKTVASKATHEPPPPNPQTGSTPAGPSKSPSKCKPVKTVTNKAKSWKNAAKQKLSPSKSKHHSTSQAEHSQAEHSQAEPHSASQAGPSQAKPHSTSQAGPSQAEPHTTSQSGPSQANPNPAPHTPSDPEIPIRRVIPPPVPPDGQMGSSYLGKIPTLYIRKW